VHLNLQNEYASFLLIVGSKTRSMALLLLRASEKELIADSADGFIPRMGDPLKSNLCDVHTRQ